MNTKQNCSAAFSQADITPDFQVELIGCDRPDGRSQGVLHPLCTQVLLFEFSGRRYCLIAIDSLGLTTALANQLRALVAGQLQTDSSCVMFNFSHTHSAPAPLSPVNGERYFQLLCDRVRKCAAEAARKLRPCKAGWALTDTEIGENRREGCTAVDKRLGALAIADAVTGRPIALVLRVTAHANILMQSNNQISSDYFGPAREKLKAAFPCPVMLMQGAAGNVKPAGVDKIRGGVLSDVDRISDILLHSAKRLHFDPAEIHDLRMVSRELEYRSDVPSEGEAGKIAEDAKRLFGIDGSKWLGECKRLRAAGVTSQAQKGEIQFLFLNEGCLCGVAEEIFCEISLEASRRAHTPYLFLNGYTNGCTGYLPHGAEWAKGGYETLYSYLEYYPFHGHVMPYRQDTADRIVGLVLDEWEQMHRP